MASDIKEVDYKLLQLDLDNPRLPANLKRTQKEILSWIAKSTAIEDLMNAIGTNGYFPGEPVVVYPSPSKATQYIVIEGNRRLTAVRLLHNPDECDKPTPQMEAIASAAKFKPTKIPVVIRPTREEVLPYLGYRHITGIREWDPLAKARYLDQLFQQTSKKKTPADRYTEVAKTIGSRRDNVKRSLDALAVYQIIENSDFYGIEGLDEETIKFSVLSTALADDRIGAFVGVAKTINKAKGPVERIPTNPIVDAKSLKKEEIKNLSKWLFEKKDGKTVVGESRNLRALGAVLASPRALAALRSKSSLSYAYRLTSGVNNDFIEVLYSSQTSLEEAASLVPNVTFDQEAFSVVKGLSNLIKQIGKTLKEKQTGKEDDDF